MPTALIENGFRFFFYSNEGSEPRHVHVEKGNGFGKIWLEPIMRPKYFYGFTTNEERLIMEIAEKHRSLLIDNWNEHFS